MNIETVHPLYTDNLELWTLINDSVAGEKEIQAKKEVYLPRAGGQNDKDYDRYLKRTRFAMFTARTAEALYGQVFSKPPEIQGEIPPLLQGTLDNVDNAGTSIDQFASDLVWNTLLKPWGGILVDYPNVPGGIDMGEVKKAGFNAYMKSYVAESMDNWRYEVIDGQKVLAMVKLEETYQVIVDDEFNPKDKVRYRVLKLEKHRDYEGIVYTQTVWEQVKNAVTQKDEWVASDPIVPILEGKPLDFIPFFPCPANEPEKSMLLPIAFLNIGHYQLTADYNNLLHYTGTPTAFALATEPIIDKKTGDIVPVQLGGSVVNFLSGQDGHTPHVFYLEPSGAGASQLLSSLENIKRDIEVMGAALIRPQKKGVETADAARIHQAGENAVLGSFTLNMSERLTPAIRLCARWRGVPQDITDKFSYQLNLDYEGTLDNVEAKNLAMREMDFDLMSRSRYLTEIEGLTDEEAEAEMAQIDKEKKGVYADDDMIPTGGVVNNDTE